MHTIMNSLLFGPSVKSQKVMQSKHHGFPALPCCASNFCNVKSSSMVATDKIKHTVDK
jgi:hypothetical protein